MVQVADHPSAAELQAGWRTSQDATLARHYRVIWLLAEGRNWSEVARLTGFVRRWVVHPGDHVGRRKGFEEGQDRSLRGLRRKWPASGKWGGR